MEQRGSDHEPLSEARRTLPNHAVVVVAPVVGEASASDRRDNFEVAPLAVRALYEAGRPNHSARRRHIALAPPQAAAVAEKVHKLIALERNHLEVAASVVALDQRDCVELALGK